MSSIQYRRLTMILYKLSPDKRETVTWVIFSLAQLCLALSGILGHYLEDQIPFLIGMLTGFSLVGNLFFLTQVKHLKRPWGKK
jgi:hypothetical protein